MKDEDVPAVDTVRLPEKYELAPDRSEIRPLLSMRRGGLAHCTLAPHGISLAVEHRTIEEIWYFLHGRG